MQRGLANAEAESEALRLMRDLGAGKARDAQAKWTALRTRIAADYRAAVADEVRTGLRPRMTDAQMDAVTGAWVARESMPGGVLAFPTMRQVTRSRERQQQLPTAIPPAPPRRPGFAGLRIGP